MQGGLEIPSVANAKLISKKKNKEMFAKCLETVQTHDTELLFDEDVIMGSSWLCLLMKMEMLRLHQMCQ